MYQPPHFREDSLAVQHALIKAHPLGLLVTLGSTGLVANPLPFVLDAAASPMGTLKTHLSRANTQWQDFDPAPGSAHRLPGPRDLHHPVLVRGQARARQGGADLELRHRAGPWPHPDQGRSGLAAAADRRHDGDPGEPARPEPWSVSDAPAPFVAAQLKGIVGIEIEIARIEGKWKVSQNRSEADRLGVSAGLRLAEDDASQRMADMVDARGALPDG